MYSESTKVTKDTQVGKMRLKALFVRFVTFVDQAIRIRDRRSRINLGRMIRLR
jgi:hypothetical protein